MIFRTLLFLLRRGSRELDISDVARTPMRVWPSDIDVLGHLNNGMYLSMMDLGRFDLLKRAGLWKRMTDAGIYPVVGSETITFRKSLQLWQRFVMESRIVGHDERSVVLEQRCVVGGEVFARAIVRGRFLRKSGGTVTIAELVRELGVALPGVGAPQWVQRWAADMALPSTRQQAPSVWE